MHLDKLKETIAHRYGFKIANNRTDFLRQIVEERARNNHFKNINSYLQELFVNDHHSEWIVLIDLLTIKETYFFRNLPQFHFLEQQIIPEYSQKRAKWNWTESGSAVKPRLKILSAACSTGEEAYSIAISIMDKLKYFRIWDIQIDAFDISLSCIKKAQQGRYTATRRMIDAVNDMNFRYLNTYFTYDDTSYQVNMDVKRLIRFSCQNIKNMFHIPPSLLPQYDLIFCRNLMIYFNRQDQIALIQFLEQSLRVGGYLMMGDGETLHLYDHQLMLVNSNSGLIYQK